MHLTILYSIYYTLSTWNPYTVVLMKSTLRDKNATITVGVDPVEDPAATAIKIYPNPAHEKVVMGFKQEGVSHIVLQDVQGRPLWRKEILVPRKEYSYEISTNDLPPGIYFVKVTFPGIQEVMRKILIK